MYIILPFKFDVGDILKVLKRGDNTPKYYRKLNFLEPLKSPHKSFDEEHTPLRDPMQGNIRPIYLLGWQGLCKAISKHARCRDPFDVDLLGP